ncbi:MAG: hypothetical protein V4607_13585 [Pseudomonadota bacterium]
MTNSTIPVSARCQCGESVSWDENSSQETVLICKKCGAELGTYGDLEAQAASTVAEKLESIFNS